MKQKKLPSSTFKSFHSLRFSYGPTHSSGVGGGGSFVILKLTSVSRDKIMQATLR